MFTVGYKQFTHSSSHWTSYAYLFTDIKYAAVCGLVGQDAARVLGQASLSPMLEGEGSIPVRDVGFSPLICDTD